MTPAVLTAAACRHWANALADATQTCRPLPPLTDVIEGLGVDDAYAIQHAGVERRRAGGSAVIGRKIGLTSTMVQTQLGVNEPDYGVLLTDMWIPDGGEIAAETLIAPRVEAEVAFVLKRPLLGPNVDEAAVVAATDHVCAAIEIVDSRIEGWRIKLPDTVADNASAASFVLGERQVQLSDCDVTDLDVVLTCSDGRLERGSTPAVLGDPCTAVAWLANKLSEYDAGLAAGDIILSGACTRMLDARPGDRFEAVVGPLGEVEVSFKGGHA